MWDLFKNAVQILFIVGFLCGIVFFVIKIIHDDIFLYFKKNGSKKAVKSITGGALNLVIGYVGFAALVSIPILVIWFISWFFGLF